MLEFDAYRGIIFGGAAVILLIELICCLLIPKRLLVEMLEAVFRIKPLADDPYLINFFGVPIHFLTSRRFRYSLVVQLAIVGWINLLLFVDGCIMQVQHFSIEDSCPTVRSDCFQMGNPSVHQRVECQSGERFSNHSASKYIVCFSWVFSEQNAVSVLNQIGICSSVFSLFCHGLIVSCRLSHKWWGLLIICLCAVATLTLFILAQVLEWPISMTAKLLLLGASALSFNIIQLLQFTHHRRKCRLSSFRSKK